MKFRFLDVISNLLASIMNYLVVVAAWAVINALAKVPDKPWLMFAFVLIPMFFYVVRLKVQGFLFFTLLHAAVPFIGISLCRDMSDKIIIGIVLVALTVISYVVSMKSEEQSEPAISPIFAGTLMFLAIMAIGMMDEERVIFIPKLALLYAALYLPYYYIDRFTWFDYINSKTITNLPSAEALKIGAPIVAGFSVFYAIAAFVGLNEKLIGGMSKKVRTLLFNIMKWLLKTDNSVLAGQEQYIPTAADASGFQFDPSVLNEDYKPSPILEFLEKAAIYLVLVFGTILLLIAIVIAVISLIKKIKGRKRSRKVKHFIDAVETREKIERRERQRPLENLFVEGSYGNRIRKLYRKMVKKNSELTDMPEHFTARTYSELFSDKLDRDKAERFAKVYEKARYSANECTKEDYLEARNLISGLM